MSFRIILALFCLLSTTVSFSQSTIKGRVIDKEGMKTLPYASVRIYLQDSLVDGTNCDANGEFSCTNKLPDGTYRAVVSYIGYSSLSFYFHLSKGESIDLGNIILDFILPTSTCIVVWYPPIIERNGKIIYEYRKEEFEHALTPRDPAYTLMSLSSSFSIE